MKFLAFGDLLGDEDIVRRVGLLDLKAYDFLLYTGDTPNPEVFKTIRHTRVLDGYGSNVDVDDYLVNHPMPKKALDKATGEVRVIYDIMAQFDRPVYGVLGNADLLYYERFIDWPFARLHNQSIEVDGFRLVGYDGRPQYIFEDTNENERAFSEEKIQSDLGKLLSVGDMKKTLLITHAPPYMILDKVEDKMLEYAVGTYGDRARDGHIGSTGLAEVVTEYKPIMHLFSHIHEAKGKVNKAGVVFLNIGSTAEYEEVCEVEIIDSRISTKFIPLPQ